MKFIFIREIFWINNFRYSIILILLDLIIWFPSFWCFFSKHLVKFYILILIDILDQFDDLINDFSFFFCTYIILYLYFLNISNTNINMNIIYTYISLWISITLFMLIVVLFYFINALLFICIAVLFHFITAFISIIILILAIRIKNFNQILVLFFFYFIFLYLLSCIVYIYIFFCVAAFDILEKYTWLISIHLRHQFHHFMKSSWWVYLGFWVIRFAGVS